MTDRPWEGLFSVQAFEFRFGARPGDPRAFFAAGPDHVSRLAERQSILDQASKRHLFELEQAENAVAELLNWAGLKAGGCRELALHWEQDFMVLLPNWEREEVFVAGAICFPSSWAPEEKLELPVHSIHVPVPTLNERLGSRIGKFLTGIRPGKAWERVNWGLSGSAELNQHPVRQIPPLSPPFTLDTVWVRREDQVLFRLPETRALIFGINVLNISVADIAADEKGRAGLYQALATMPDDISRYKNITGGRDQLLELLTP